MLMFLFYSTLIILRIVFQNSMFTIVLSKVHFDNVTHLDCDTLFFHKTKVNVYEFMYL